MFKEEFALAIAIDVILIKSDVCLFQVVMGSNIPMCSILEEYKRLCKASCNYTNGRMDLNTHN
jgi:hypothetical protein